MLNNPTENPEQGSLPNEGGKSASLGITPNMTQLTSEGETETLALDQDTEKVMKAFENAQMEKLAKLTSFEESLKALVIQGQDVDFLVKHFDVTKGLAERVLRMAGGDIKVAIIRMTQ